MIPFTDNGAHVKDDYCTERRLWETVAFLRIHGVGEKILDIGESNFVGENIQADLNVRFQQTDKNADLNWGFTLDPHGFDTVTCFEVIEHLMNPLFLVKAIWLSLKPSGVLYLSTPLHNPHGFFFNTTAHFAEYKEESLVTLLEYGGFAVTHTHRFKSIPFWQGMRKGVGLFRTFLRVSSQESIIIRAVKV